MGHPGWRANSTDVLDCDTSGLRCVEETHDLAVIRRRGGELHPTGTPEESQKPRHLHGRKEIIAPRSSSSKLFPVAAVQEQSSMQLLLPSSSFSSPPLRLPLTISTSTRILLLLLPTVSALPHVSPPVTPPTPCGCVTEAEAASLPAPFAKRPLVSVSECHQHCSEAPFFTFPTSHGR